MLLFFQDPQKAPVTDGVDHWGQLPVLASTFGDVDALFYFTLVVCIFFFVLITAILGYSVVKYRRKTYDQPAASNLTHHTTLEVVWTVIPLIIVMVIFAWGWKGSLDMTSPPADARPYRIVASQWKWTVFHPNSSVPADNVIYVEVDKPALFRVEAQDVLHSFAIPAMRVKRDAVPGRPQLVWFTPKQIGEYHLFCAEYCGLDHSRMLGTVVVVGANEFNKTPPPWDQIDKDPLVNGKNTFINSCKSCHTVDGSVLTGPSFKDLWGREETVIDQTGNEIKVKVDRDYVFESIREPTRKKVAGVFKDRTMTPFDKAILPDNRVEFLIDYLKSISSHTTEAEKKELEEKRKKSMEEGKK